MQIYSSPASNGGFFNIKIDPSRDRKMTDFGRATVTDRYLQPGESIQDMFGRVACYFADDASHAQRLYDYISNHWFMPATPILSNGGTDRGLPISCFLNTVSDSLEGIQDAWNENMWLAARGGGIGTNWSDVRGIGEPVGDVGETSGIIPFIKVMDSQTLAISQGSLRRGSAAVYLDIDHPEIEEFVDIRRPTGDQNRRSLNIHHGVNITDAFMEAVERGDDWDLIARSDGSVRKTVKARELWIKILQTRMETGEPYMLFIDTVNRALPEHQKKLGLKVKQSNLCSEITLPTGRDHCSSNRTAVCCLSSLNLERYLEWREDDQFIPDVMTFLDNVLRDFIRKTTEDGHFRDAGYSASMERSVGLGVMGFASFLQSQRVPFESAVAVSWNKKIFKHIQNETQRANEDLGKTRGNCTDFFDSGLPGHRRFSNCTAVAPTASISIICGTTSPGIEPFTSNTFTQKTLSGSFPVKSRFLSQVITDYQMAHEKTCEWVEAQWASIREHEGSVQHLEWMEDHHKDVFKTAWEIDPAWYVQHMADRAPLVDQAVSNNLFLDPQITTKELHAVHFNAWKRGVKSLYYCRSKSVSRAEKINKTDTQQDVSKYEECMVCQ